MLIFKVWLVLSIIFFYHIAITLTNIERGIIFMNCLLSKKVENGRNDTSRTV